MSEETIEVKPRYIQTENGSFVLNNTLPQEDTHGSINMLYNNINVIIIIVLIIVIIVLVYFLYRKNNTSKPSPTSSVLNINERHDVPLNPVTNPVTVNPVTANHVTTNPVNSTNTNTKEKLMDLLAKSKNIISTNTTEKAVVTMVDPVKNHVADHLHDQTADQVKNHVADQTNDQEDYRVEEVDSAENKSTSSDDNITDTDADNMYKKTELCSYVLESGRPCKTKVKTGCDRCWRHDNL